MGNHNPGGMVMATAGFSLELESGALTRCQGLSLTCLCRNAGTLVASDGTKLYRLGGETDEGPPSRFR